MLHHPHFIGPAPALSVFRLSPQACRIARCNTRRKKEKKRRTLLSRDSVICKPSGQSTARPSLYNVRFSSETLQQGSITTALTHTHTPTSTSAFLESVLFPTRFEDGARRFHGGVDNGRELHQWNNENGT